jgi:hypothetical protein
MDQKILRDKVAAMPVLIGNRLFDHRDFEEFSHHYYANGYSPQFFNYIGGTKEYKLRDILAKAADKVEKISAIDNKLLAVFPILTLSVVDAPDLVLDFLQTIKKIMGIRIYPIVWDGGFEMIFREFTGDKALKLKLVAEEHLIYIYFDSDAPTAGAGRLGEFIERIMGDDLGGNYFPDYNPGDVQKISMHINHERFNFWYPAKKSIPKYPIKDGKPQFPIITTTVQCPKCGEEKEVDRYTLDEAGGIKLKCFNFPTCQYSEVHYLPDIASQFDPWPEFEIYKKEIMVRR